MRAAESAERIPRTCVRGLLRRTPGGSRPIPARGSCGQLATTRTSQATVVRPPSVAQTTSSLRRRGIRRPATLRRPAGSSGHTPEHASRRACAVPSRKPAPDGCAKVAPLPGATEPARSEPEPPRRVPPTTAPTLEPFAPQALPLLRAGRASNPDTSKPRPQALAVAKKATATAQIGARGTPGSR